MTSFEQVWSESEMHREATEATGLSDFGSDGYREGLSRLLHAIRTEAGLPEETRPAARRGIVQLLKNRLLIQDSIQRLDLRSVHVRRPFLVAALQRTGSTLLQRLLCLGPRCHGPRLWELLGPAPPVDPEDRAAVARRQAETRPGAQKMAEHIGRHVHDFAHDQPSQCLYLFWNSFLSPWFGLRHHVPSYVAWALEQDPRESYAYYKTQLQLILYHRRDARLVLKCTSHQYNLPVLLETIPDVCIIHLIRDPKKSIPSSCHLFEGVRSTFEPHPSREVVRNDCLAYTAAATARVLRDRDAVPRERILEVQYADLVRDHVGVVRRIYEYFDHPFDDATAEAIRRYLAENPPNKWGVHKYSAADYGIQASDIERCAGQYAARFSAVPE